MTDASNCYMSSLDLFSRPVINTTIIDSKPVTYFPNNPINEESPIEFNITAPEYTDLNDHYLRLILQVVRKDGAAMGDADNGKVIIAPLPGNSIFSSCENYINGHLINHANFSYGYRSFLENLSTYTNSDINGQLSLSIFAPDHHGKHTTLDAMFVDSNGVARRRELSLDDEFECITRINTDLFSQQKLILPYVANRIKLYRSKPGFALITKNDSRNTYKLILKEISLTIKHVTVAPSINNAHKILLQKHNSLYSLRRIELLNFNVPGNTRNFNLDNLYLGRLPIRIILGLVNSKSYEGDPEYHPYQFVHADINKIALYMNGEVVNGTPFTPDFGSGNSKNRKYGREYLSLFQATNQTWANNAGFAQGLWDYRDGFTLFGFNLSTSGYNICSDKVIEAHRHGSIRLELGFAEDLPEPHTLIVFAEYNASLEINKTRDVLIDYTP